ncbi:MAG: recombination protein NinB [Sideroxydans sp.]|nr:recombination protein NinB [Sideroxydans sp.]
MSELNSYRRYFILAHDTARKLAAAQCALAPDGYVVEIKPATRTLEQNARMWACLNAISEQVVWHSRKLTSEEWKIVFTAALKKQDVIPGIDGGFVAMGQSTSKMNKREMADLMTLMDAFAAEQGVEVFE